MNRDTLLKFYETKSYFESMNMIDKVYEDHQNFLMEFSDDVDIHVDVNNYEKRLDVVYKAVKKRIKEVEEL